MKMCDKSLFARDLRNRPIVIDRFLKNEIDVRQAAARLELSCSYTYKLAQIARTDGAGSLAYLKKRGKPPKRFEILGKIVKKYY